MLKPALLFGFFGPLIGVAALYVILLLMEAVSGRPVRSEHILDDFGSMLLIGWMFGFVPALLTGALLSRWSASSTLALALKSAAIGAIVSSLFFGAIFGVGLFGAMLLDLHLLRFVAPFAVAGGVAAVACAMLSRRYLQATSPTTATP